MFKLGERKINSFLALIGLLTTALFFQNCGSSKSSSGRSAAPNHIQGLLSLTVDTSQELGVVSPYLFGVNFNWNLQAMGSIDRADLLLDRSFQLQAQGDTTKKRWHEFPAAGSGGTVTFVATAGDTSPSGGNAANGFYSLQETSTGYNCIDQVLLQKVTAGISYDLHFSSFGQGSAPALVAFLADGSRMPISNATSMIASANGSWTRHAVSLAATGSSDIAVFRLCQFTAGTVKVDEVRLNEAGGEPAVKTAAKTQMQNLKIKSLRWPGGTLVDTYFWKKVIGSRLNRAEMADDNGQLETPALGLHEFLNLCESLNILPLVQINANDTAANASDLVEYILGDSSTTQGALRAANGHAAPWSAAFFEIGNEAVFANGAQYVSLAKPIMIAMRAKADALGKTIQLGAIAEANFQLAPWLQSASPALFNWNNDVLVGSSGLGAYIDFTTGHYYSYGSFDSDEKTRYQNIMSSGEIMGQIIDGIQTKSNQLPFALTEFQVDMKIGNVVQTNFLMDFQSGLTVGQMYQTLIAKQIAGANLFNFSQQNGYGMTHDTVHFNWRPTGVVFSLYSALSGSTLLQSKLSGTSDIKTTTIGNIPDDLTFADVNAVATKISSSSYQIVLLNADYKESKTVAIEIKGFSPKNIHLSKYSNDDLAANNETNANAVKLSTDDLSASDILHLKLEPHSIVRLDLNK